MRWVLLLAFCIAAGATAWGGVAEEEGALRVTIGYALPTADPEDTDNRLGRRYWDVSPPVIVESQRWCDRAELTTDMDLFFNDRPLARENDGAYEEELRGKGHNFEARALGPGDASAGETVKFTATARCYSRGEVSTGSITRTFELPKASCDLGPLRVGEVSGDVSVLDWNHWDDESDRRILRAGDVVNGGSELRVGRGGKVELGETECNGFRVTMFEGQHGVGGYDREGRGGPFTAERAAAAGDAHAGGISVPGRATIWPLDNRCRACLASQASSYEVRSTAKRVTVRVYAGAVLVGGPEGAPKLRVPAGHQASVLCSDEGCLPSHLRLFQENEPWSTPPEGISDDFPRVATGDPPHPSALAPAFSRVEAKPLPAAGGQPDQIVVAWSRQVRQADGAYFSFSDRTEEGFVVWQREAPSRWKVVYEQRPLCCPSLSIQTGDLTRDGHLDALINEAQGSGACGPSRVLLTSDQQLVEAFAYDGCDYSMTIKKGTVVLQDGVGPCPYDQGAHCSGGTRTTVKRWNGSRLVTQSETVKCHEPTLDPARGCAPKPKRNTP